MTMLLSALFLAIFCITLFAAYIIIRRELLDIRTAGLLCAALSSSALFAFGVVRELQMLHTVAVAVAVGLGFTLVVVAMAAFFKANQPPDADAILKPPSSDRTS